MKCLTCKHCCIDFGSPGYSEMTPGHSGSWKCHKHMWGLSDYDGKEDVEKAFEMGESCTMWESDRRKPKETA